jgi:V8-like Glu-specific endopeptidase
VTKIKSVVFILAWLATFGLYMGYTNYARSQEWDDGSVAVGALFVHVGIVTVDHPFCTATVVPSRKGNLLITAAHCLGTVPVADIRFAPFYHNGVAPFGEYAVTSQTFAPGWNQDGDPNSDVAFLTVAGNVQRRVGAEQLGYSSPTPRRVTVDGYSAPNGETVCTAAPTTISVRGKQQMRFACPGFLYGSSGGPFLVRINHQSGHGTIVGVLGGFHNGGDSSSVSYSSPFGWAVHKLYARLRVR